MCATRFLYGNFYAFQPKLQSLIICHNAWLLILPDFQHGDPLTCTLAKVILTGISYSPARWMPVFEKYPIRQAPS